MRAKPVLIGVGGVLGGLILLAGLLLFTPPGVSLLGRLAQTLSGGLVRLEGLNGATINNLRAARVEIADAEGVWLRVEDVALRWSIFALLADRVVVHDANAARIFVLRRPVPSQSASSEGPRIDVARLDLPAIMLAEPVIGQVVTLTAAGSLRYLSLDDFAADIRIARVGNNDAYRMDGGVAAQAAHGHALIREGEDGILGRLVGLPGLGPVNLRLDAQGPRDANRIALQFSAGALTAEGGGVLRLAQEEAALDLRLSSGEMSPREDMGWESLSGEARIRGRFDAPVLAAQLQLAGGRFAGFSTRAMVLSVNGDRGTARLKGTVEGMMLPGAHPAIFAATPFGVSADVDLQAAARPVRLSLTHRLAQLEGTVRTRGGLSLEADLDIPSLAPFAALENVALDGRAALHVTLRQTGTRLALAANAQLDTRGAALPARLLGGDAAITLTAQMDGADIIASQARVTGAGLSGDIAGTLRQGEMDYRVSLQLRDLSRLVQPVAGALSLSGTLRGPLDDIALAARGSASLATEGFARQSVAIQLSAQGLPALRRGSLSADGRFNDAPLQLRATLNGGKVRRADVTASWKSLAADADLMLGDVVTGHARLTVGALSDFSAFAGGRSAGALDATADLTARGRASDADLRLVLSAPGLDDLAAQGVTVRGQVRDVLGAPDLALTLQAQGIQTPVLTGDAEAKLDGPLARVSVTASARLAETAGGAISLRGAGEVNVPGGVLRLASLEGEWRGTALKLQGPAVIRYGETVAVEGLALRAGKGTLAADGQIMPRLALRATVRALALEDFRALYPEAGLQGTLSVDADLSGSLTLPEGHISVRADGVRTIYGGRALPPGSLRADLRLSGGRASIDAVLQAGARVSLTLQGDAPLSATDPMSLRASGQADLALLDIVLAPDGRRVRGALALDAAITGTPGAPRITGNGALSGGEFHDYRLGMRIADIAATLVAEGERLRITRMTARAGPGSISGNGALDLAPGLPIEIALRAERARPIAGDLITATVSGDVRLSGMLSRQMTASGALQVLEGEINLPERFPPEVAVLNVRRNGETPPTPPQPQSRIDLDVSVQSIGPLFVRGRGIEAEMGGDIRVTGTSALPLVNGAFRLVRGNYTLGGQRLDFSSGTVRFDGTGLRQRLDPTLDFMAQTVSGGITARLAVTGYASAPRIALSSTPSLPQDEIVAHLLFQQSVRQLSPLQLAGIAQAAASLGGLGGGFNPLGVVRRTLGLDRLSVGSINDAASGQSQTTVEAGSYVLRNVYLGVRQNLSGGTQTQVQVDVTDRLKAQATVNIGGATAQGNAQQDQGSSIGLSYQLEY